MPVKTKKTVKKEVAPVKTEKNSIRVFTAKNSLEMCIYSEALYKCGVLYKVKAYLNDDGSIKKYMFTTDPIPQLIRDSVVEAAKEIAKRQK